MQDGKITTRATGKKKKKKKKQQVHAEVAEHAETKEEQEERKHASQKGSMAPHKEKPGHVGGNPLFFLPLRPLHCKVVLSCFSDKKRCVTRGRVFGCHWPLGI